MPRWLYLLPLNFVIVSFLVFAAIFLLMIKRSRDKNRKADPLSIIAIFIQALAFAIAWTIGLIIASIVYYLGTVMRVRSEEKLLREQFGSQYEEYAREVPALIPIRLR